MNHLTGTIKLVFYSMGKEIYHREYNNATTDAIMNEFKFISDLGGFYTPADESFDTVFCYWQYDGRKAFRQWILIVD